MCLFAFKDNANDNDADDGDDFDNDVVLFYVGHSIGLFNLEICPSIQESFIKKCLSSIFCVLSFRNSYCLDFGSPR